MSNQGSSQIVASSTPHVSLGSRYFEAIEYASDKHAHQPRKGKSTAYICHPLGVSALVLEANGDEDQAIIGLLHDVAEDCGGLPILSEVEERFGTRVARGVEGCSDSLVEDPLLKAPWEVRKTQHFTHLRASANPDVIIVTAADKLHNARAIWTDLQIGGVEALAPFTFPGKITWYYNQVLEVLKEKQAPKILTVQLENVVKGIEAYVEGKVLPEPRNPNA